mmetsp:Transcript_99589/g.286359  ORF Transcript_99589/g.286359 Transcript_99589/m.286359 type:complete len:295 (-) Transcript_99589:536-1420(-)
MLNKFSPFNPANARSGLTPFASAMPADSCTTNKPSCSSNSTENLKGLSLRVTATFGKLMPMTTAGKALFFALVIRLTNLLVFRSNGLPPSERTCAPLGKPQAELCDPSPSLSTVHVSSKKIPKGFDKSTITHLKLSKDGLPTAPDLAPGLALGRFLGAAGRVFAGFGAGVNSASLSDNSGGAEAAGGPVAPSGMSMNTKRTGNCASRRRFTTSSSERPWRASLFTETNAHPSFRPFSAAIPIASRMRHRPNWSSRSTAMLNGRSVNTVTTGRVVNPMDSSFKPFAFALCTRLAS